LSCIFLSSLNFPFPMVSMWQKLTQTCALGTGLTLVIYINSLRLWQSLGPWQKADWARPSTHGVRVRHRRPTGPGPALTEFGSVTEGRPGSARHSRTPGFPPTGPAVEGVGSGPSQKADRARLDTPTAVTEPGVRKLCVFGGGGQRWWGRKSHEWVV
jgi:hypothetical protein